MNREVVERVARSLNSAGVPFIIVGGLAVIAHGYGRTTQDLDLVIRLEAGMIRATFLALGQLGYCPIIPVTADAFADETQRSRWVAEKGMTVLSFFSEQFRLTAVDVFASEPFDFQTEYGAAMVEDIAPGVPVRVVRLETLLRLKLQAGRPQDLADVAQLQKLHGKSAHG